MDREGEKNAACVDVFNTYYGHPDIPIGLVKNGINNPVVWNDYSGIAQWKDSAGNCLFHHSIKDFSTLPDGWELYRTQLRKPRMESDISSALVAITLLMADW